MSVRSTTFGGVRLTGEEAEKFLRQVTYGRPKKAAQEAAARGDSMLAELRKTGRIVTKEPGC